MRKIFPLCLAVIIALLALIVLFRRQSGDITVRPSDNTPEVSAEQLHTTTPTENPPTSSLPPPKGEEEIRSNYEEQQRRYQQALKNRIDFYGVVQDQFGQPVPAAKVTLRVVDKPWVNPPKIEKTANENGAFSLTGARGAAVSVYVSKEGYHKIKTPARSIRPQTLTTLELTKTQTQEREHGPIPRFLSSANRRSPIRCT